jgi:tripartite-type tricarboxylate transporter receptor subunit TctC
VTGAPYRTGRRAFLARSAAGTAAAVLGSGAWAQAWPAKPIRVVLGYTPGGAADLTARELGAVLGQPLVVDYKAGASGTIAAAEIARAAPDGYTLGLLDNAPLTIVPALRNTGYDPLASFSHLGMVTQLPQVLVASTSAGVSTTKELIDAMRRQPGKFNYGSGGSGSVGHLAAELFKLRTQTFAVHVPFRGGAPTITALLAGDIQFAFLTASATGPMIASGKLKALGVSSAARLASLPNVPTISESGVPKFEAPGWFALVGPAGLPDSVVAPLRKAVAEMLAMPALATRLEALGQTPAPGQLDVRAALGTELATWKKLFSERKIAVDS